MKPNNKHLSYSKKGMIRNTIKQFLYTKFYFYS